MVHPAKKPRFVRDRQLATIHIAKAQVGMAEDTYRQLLRDKFSVASSADLNQLQRAQLLDHFAKLGFVSTGRERLAAKGPMRVADDRQALMGKIDALLLSQGRTRAYIETGMVKRICKVDALAFCTPEQLQKLIAALTYDANRRA